MPRVKRGMMHVKNRRNILKRTKGYMYGRKNKLSLANTAIEKSGQHSFRDRRDKKGVRRRLWNVQINAAVRGIGLTYSRFINLLKVKQVGLDRKVMATIANNHPEVFNKIVESVK